MITNTGKDIIAKYLLGQTQSYASYIAIGCGANPLATGDFFGDYSTKQSLDFEMIRVPISSRGYVNDNGVSKIVLTAELPTEERYEITEIGIYSAGSNPSAGAYDSKTILAFTTGETWQHHTAESSALVPLISAPLDDPLGNNIIAVADPVFQTNANNSIFYKTARVNRYERCRFLNNTILIQGDQAELTPDIANPGQFIIEEGSNHIHLNNPGIDLTKNAPSDELKLAFSVVNTDGDAASSPDSVRIMVEFATTEDSGGQYARFETEVVNGIGTGEYDFDTNRYFIVTKELQQLHMTTNFTWNAVTVVKIYASAVVAGVPSSDYYIALDAMRLENTSVSNPLYGLTGYSVVKNDNAETIIKSPNTNNYIEFRFALGLTGDVIS